MRPPRFSIKPIHVIAPMAALALFGLLSLPSASAETRDHGFSTFSQGAKLGTNQGE